MYIPAIDPIPPLWPTRAEMHLVLLDTYIAYVVERQPFGYAKGRGCVYNGPEGEHCAIGRLANVPHDYETSDATFVVNKLNGVDSTHMLSRFWDKLQNSHDEAAVDEDHDYFGRVLQEIAGRVDNGRYDAPAEATA